MIFYNNGFYNLNNINCACNFLAFFTIRKYYKLQSHVKANMCRIIYKDHDFHIAISYSNYSLKLSYYVYFYK